MTKSTERVRAYRERAAKKKIVRVEFAIPAQHVAAVKQLVADYLEGYRDENK